MTSTPTISTFCTLLEKTREDLYRLADCAPALSARLTAATLAITEILTHLGEPTMTSQDLHEQLLTASNSVAVARDEPFAHQEVRLELAGAFAALGKAREHFARSQPAHPRRHLRLVHSA